MIHQLKVEREYFEDILSCRKSFEVRNNDRGFCVGDILGLNEIDEKSEETGRCTLAEVIYMLQNNMLQDGYAVLGIAPFPTVDNALSTTTISNYEKTSQRVNGYLVIE